MRTVVVALVLGLLITAIPVEVARATSVPVRTTQEVRALWVVRTSLASPAHITRLVQNARDSGFNTLLVQVRGRGDAYFRDGLEPRAASIAGQPASFDPLDQTLKQAHAAGLQVHAWVNVNLIASASPVPHDPRHLVTQHPEWLMVPRALGSELARLSPRDPRYVARLAAWSRARGSSIEGLYASPIPRDSAHHLEAVISDLARRYPIDGLHLDYVRYPTADFDYSAAALSAFRASVITDLPAAERASLDARLRREPLIYAERFPDRYTRYRRVRLTDLVARLRMAVKKYRPDAIISAAVKPDAREAQSARLQDWSDWASRGLIDVICPMAYIDDVQRFAESVANATRSAAPQPMWAGIGAYRLDSAQTVRHIHAARAAGAQGIALFSYDSLAGPALQSIGRTAFADTGTPVASTR